MQSSHGININWMNHLSRTLWLEKPKDQHTLGVPSGKNVTCVNPEDVPVAANSNQRPKKKRSVSDPTITALVADQSSSTKAAAVKSEPPPRRNSWLSSISSKLSSATSINSQHSIKVISNLGATVPKIYRGASKKAKSEIKKPCNDVPKKPLLPRTSQPAFLQNTLKRLSISSTAGVSQGKIRQETGICKRMLLNVDRNRERCEIKELNGNRLRRVAFCVDIEVSSCPKYLEESEELEEEVRISCEPVANEIDLPTEDLVRIRERLSKKEKKRKIAEAYGTLPVEFTRKNSFKSPTSPIEKNTTQYSIATDPVRIYRRCCQLRETPILKKISEQLACFSNQTRTIGVIDKLDLSNYYLELADLITLGDYLAVVPVYELNMQNCGLTDEGVRVILAGLLAAKSSRLECEPSNLCQNGHISKAGFVEKLVLENNIAITKEGWMYICTFIAMCRSVKSIDLSRVPFPPAVPLTLPIDTPVTAEIGSTSPEISDILRKSIAGRFGGQELKILNMAHCGLSTEQIGNLIDGAIKSGLCRLGLAGNRINPHGLQHIVRFIREGQCEGLDLGNNDLGDQLHAIAEILDEKCQLYALSLSCCNLTPKSLCPLIPALTRLKNFGYLDLSQNTKLFDSNSSAISLFRRYLPKIQALKRISLMSVSLTPDQAISLAEILPELPELAHVNIMENRLLASLASSSADNEADQGDACALYASLMAATRASQSIVSIDIEVPSPESSETVKAFAKQVVAYCLWNLDQKSTTEISIGHEKPAEKDEAVLDALIHLVDHGGVNTADDVEAVEGSRRVNEYIISGTGVAKALEVCLKNRGNEGEETISPRGDSCLSLNDRTKEMSKFLLKSARRVRVHLLSTMIKESGVTDSQFYQKLSFLDETLGSIIKRFEDEYPETRLPPSNTCIPLSPPSSTKAFDDSDDSDSHDLETDSEATYLETPPIDEGYNTKSVLSWHSLEVLKASRILGKEEGKIHRFGQQLKRDILKPDGEDEKNQDVYPMHFELLRELIEEVGGEELKIRILLEGADAVLEEIKKGVSTLCKQLREKDPKAWAKIIQSEEIAQDNQQAKPDS